MNHCLSQPPSEEHSSFNQGLMQIQQQAGQYCNLQTSGDLTQGQSWWQNLWDLIHSGFNNFTTNYELLALGEIGAIFMVALVPLLLGLILEVTLIASHIRKDKLANQQKYQEALALKGRVLADQLQEQNQRRKPYQIFWLSMISLQVLLVGFFLLAGPEYDRDVWCDEHRTQFAILTTGLETEKLQADQRRANCEIRQAVTTLQTLFSKENKNTINNIKKVSSQLNGSVKKLDKANASIDDFKVKIEKATENTEDVLKTLSIMQTIAAQLGINHSEGPMPLAKPAEQKRNLPEHLVFIEGILEKQATQDWMTQQILSKQEFQTQTAINQSRQSDQFEVIQANQTLLAEQLINLEKELLSQAMIDSIAKKVADNLARQNVFDLYPSVKRPPSVMKLE